MCVKRHARIVQTALSCQRAAGVINTLDHLPLVPSILKLVGLGALLWFWARCVAAEGPRSGGGIPPAACVRAAGRLPHRPALLRAGRRFLVYHPGRAQLGDDLEEIRGRLQAFADGVDDTAAAAGASRDSGL
jgi:hypothetical protein